MIQKDLSADEKAALHELQLGSEHLYRAYGKLLDFHHAVGHAMDRFANAEENLRAAGYTELADELRDQHLPAGVIDDKWTYEIVEEFEHGFLAATTDFEKRVCLELAEGMDHVSERELQSMLRVRSRQQGR
ncbi:MULTISPECIES: hypothetical protein [unclassified Haladaptatus]|uniref:hypothetical protein n=1 Tax=unclassified Haladaptatus TaxID=2622732 RepID=UPI0023E80931|nr:MULTISPECIES: hypothetical protein [unclassified Haladaptatus]